MEGESELFENLTEEKNKKKMRMIKAMWESDGKND